MLRDVTERENAEENLKALAGALDQSTVLVRRWDGTVIHWTAGCETSVRLDSAEAVGNPVHELLKTTFQRPSNKSSSNFSFREPGKANWSR